MAKKPRKPTEDAQVEQAAPRLPAVVDPAAPEQPQPEAKPNPEPDEEERPPYEVCAGCGRPLPPHYNTGGHPTEYDPAVAEVILARIAEGTALIEVCREADMPHHTTFRQWVTADRDGLAVRYARACEQRWIVESERLLKIADDSKRDIVMTEDGPRVDWEVVNRARLRVDTRKWLLSRMLPAIFGDKLTLDGGLTITNLTDEQLNMGLEEALIALGIPDDVLEFIRPYFVVEPLPTRPPLRAVKP